MNSRATCCSVVCTFAQECDEHSCETQELKVTITHQGAGAYIVLETERWAADSPEEIHVVIQRAWAHCHKLIDEDGL